MKVTKSSLYEKADELRAIATMGKHHSQNEYDTARYERLLDIALQLVSELDERPWQELKDEYVQDNWVHVSPMHGAEAVVIREGKILLMKRNDNGLWCVPGGLVEVGETLAESAVRELKEEVGLDGTVSQLLGIFDSRKWNSTVRSQMYHAIFLVECRNSDPTPSSEAIEVGFFARNDLPPLARGHDMRVPFLFQILDGTVASPYFDR